MANFSTIVTLSIEEAELPGVTEYIRMKTMEDPISFGKNKDRE